VHLFLQENVYMLKLDNGVVGGQRKSASKLTSGDCRGIKAGNGGCRWSEWSGEVHSIYYID
jgi:hypothetical protein